MNRDLEAALSARVRAAAAAGEPLRITGGGTRASLCVQIPGRPLELAGHAGVIDYRPAELVLTARAGTPLAELETVLAAQGQMLPFEPPCFGPASTLGGAVAVGMSGPRRPWTGAVRDFVLGARVINGRGEALRFGGQVMKNVAGYDVARLMVGARGTLGVITEVSLKVLPCPECERTLQLELDAGSVLRRLAEWGRRPLPLSAAAWERGALRVRLSGAESAVRAAALHIGGVEDPAGAAYWRSLRNLRHPLLCADAPRLWRLAVPPAAPLPEGPEEPLLLDWGGAQRWLQSARAAGRIHRMATALGGYATIVRGGGAAALSPALAGLHRRLKRAFDPAGVLNPGVLGALC